MKLIFAQGNPGNEYAKTRHNVGWQILDALAEREEGSFLLKSKFNAELAEIAIEGQKVLLAKPTTYYNETGTSARALVDFYKLDPVSDVLIVHDELALPLGTLRLRHKGSDAGNNGIKSLSAHLGEHYHRLRIGVANELRDRMEDTDFVLSRFSSDEQTLLKDKVTPKALEVINDFIVGHHEATSHTFVD